MSRETPQNREEIVYRKGNVLLFVGFPGETVAEEWKCPGKRHKIGRNCCRGMKMSWEAPQNREKLQPLRENVPESATNPGETAAKEQKKAPGAIPGARY